MRIITEPTVTMVGVTRFVDHPQYKLPNGGTDCERLIAMGGKGCYDSYGEDGRSIDQHIAGIIHSRHGSVLEHANITVFIEGISRGCSHEIVRHRAGFAYSQRSTRYTEEGDAAIVLDPYTARLWIQMQDDLQGAENSEPLNLDQSAILNNALISFEKDLEGYQRKVDYLMSTNPMGRKGTDLRKWCRGIARQQLPHALETRMTMTGNLRAWRWFLKERSGTGAEAEIRRLSNAVMNCISIYAPLVFEDMLANPFEFEGYLSYDGGELKV